MLYNVVGDKDRSKPGKVSLLI